MILYIKQNSRLLDLFNLLLSLSKSLPILETGVGITDPTDPWTSRNNGEKPLEKVKTGPVFTISERWFIVAFNMVPDSTP